MSEYFCPKLLSSKISLIFGGGFDTCGIWLWWIYKANGKTTTSSQVDYSSGIPNWFHQHRRTHSQQFYWLIAMETKGWQHVYLDITIPIYVSRWNLKWNIAQFHWNVFRLINPVKIFGICETIVWKFWRSLLRKSTHMRFNGCIILLLS